MDVPVVIGGIEASLRRFTHYDYWADALMPSILVDSGADLLVYGMGEMPLRALVARLRAGQPWSRLTDIPQTAYLADRAPAAGPWDDITLASHEVCLRDKRRYAANFRHIEEESNRYRPPACCSPWAAAGWW